jgi:hypothetical protein
MWQEAMSDLNEQIHIEDDTLDLAPGEKRPTVRCAPGFHHCLLPLHSSARHRTPTRLAANVSQQAHALCNRWVCEGLVQPSMPLSRLQVPPVTPAQAFQHYAALYVKYVQIFRKLEAAYDNMVHPQKRLDVKSVLEMVQVCRRVSVARW